MMRLLLTLTFALKALASPEDVYSKFYQTSDVSASSAATVVSGDIPSYVVGRSIHNGCGGFGFGPHSFSHVFDCYAKLHSWDFQGDGTVTFSTQFMRTNFYNQSVGMEDIWPSIYFGVESPRFGMKDRMSAMMNSKPADGPDTFDNLNVNLWDFGLSSPDGSEKMVLALTDGLIMRGVGVESLNTYYFAFDDFSATMNGTTSSAHPKYIPGTQTSVNYFIKPNNMLSSQGTIYLYKHEYGSTKIDTFFEADIPSVNYMHSISVTPNYAIIFLNNCHFSEKCVMSSMEKNWKGVQSCFSWDDSLTSTTILVVELKSGEIKMTSKAPPLFTLHHANAYEEEDGSVVLDLCAFEDSSILQATVFQSATLLDEASRNAYKAEFVPPRYHRLVLKGDGKDAEEKIIPSYLDGQEYPFDFPLTNPKYAGRKHCIVYGQDSPFAGGSDKYSATAWVKLNVCTEEVLVFTLEDHFATGDASFVPDPDSEEEDAGVLMTAWIDGTGEGETYFRIIDAKSMEEVATVRFKDEEDKKIFMPYAFHGIRLEN
mmetsp:Transcript_21542/g.40530  ORF Transcript_21542/g.40530 Transcript_21542/m.40530 type:complete len:540 (+) Transcript_21542:72-1691(+)